MRDVVREEWHWTLWTFWKLRETREFERIEAEKNRIDGAYLNALAFHEPNRLREETQNFLDRAGYTVTEEDAMRSAKQTVRDMARIDAAEAAAEKIAAAVTTPA